MQFHRCSVSKIRSDSDGLRSSSLPAKGRWFREYLHMKSGAAFGTAARFMPPLQFMEGKKSAIVPRKRGAPEINIGSVTQGFIRLGASRCRRIWIRRALGPLQGHLFCLRRSCEILCPELIKGRRYEPVSGRSIRATEEFAGREMNVELRFFLLPGQKCVVRGRPKRAGSVLIKKVNGRIGVVRFYLKEKSNKILVSKIKSVSSW